VRSNDRGIVALSLDDRIAPVDGRVLQSMTIDRVYDEIDILENIVNQRFDRLEGGIQELNRKFDIVMQHITGQGETTYE
jgi:transcription elongation factor